MLIETIAPDFLIKALNKKILADCLIKENARNAHPQPSPPEHSGAWLPGAYTEARTRAYSRGPEPLVTQGSGAPGLYALSLYTLAYTLTLPEAASQQCRRATLLTSRRA